ncbi:MAG: tyrosine-type recombinase/integrase [Defluviitaleaceae bacterium]|nr:tyrosine-type recombinase/integrase [Defluviitaleaceae bacterium]MCL2262749.1 tyrosine-type recombinase/integrase [Defluviitaleaceae bacterium]
MTLCNALDSFILDQRLKGNTDKTIRGYQGFLSQFITWLEKNEITSATELTLKHVQSYQLHIGSRQCENKSQKLTRRTVRTYMRHIRIFLSYCYAEGFIIEPIHLKLKLPKAEKPVIEILTDDEIELLLSVFGDDILARRNRAIICLMLDCGLRVSEVVGVSAADINFANAYLKVTGKGRKSRIVPIGQKVKTALTDYIHERSTIGGKLFLSSRETPLTSAGIIQLMNRLKNQTGIHRLHAHLLRHTFATNFLIHGLGDVHDLSRLLGHSELKITESYLHLASYYSILQNRARQTYLDIKEARKL